MPFLPESLENLAILAELTLKTGTLTKWPSSSSEFQVDKPDNHVLVAS